MANSANARRVVVTGMGVVTPLGLNVNDFWNGLLTGQSGAVPITYFDTTAYDTKFACQLKGFDPLQYIERKQSQHLDANSQYALAAAAQAVADAGLNPAEMSEEEREMCGVNVGSSIGGIASLQKQFEIMRTRGPGRLSPFAVPQMLTNMAGAHISIKYGFYGPNYSVVSACATGNDNMATAFNLIQSGDANLMLAGGTDAAICESGIGSFNAMRALSRRNDDPATASRPFDKDRDGFVMGEGAGVLVLEELEHARQRGARIYAEFLGVGSAADASHITNPDQLGQIRAVKHLMRKAGFKPEDVDYINMHATSTGIGDLVETQAIKRLFGDHVRKMNVSATKSMTGHLLGAAGAIEAVTAIMATVYNTIPPTINTRNLDPECASELNYTLGQPVERKVRVALSNAFGFGGHSSCAAFRKFEG
jgi:3-oxoacyl-[acyl-carrier-protein] synthase II